jgi:acetylglutamate/LysW-gamma-L-alpha-aminoadipate kinase
MKRKILALRKLFEAGAGTVIIADGRTEHPVRDALNGKGTRIQ